MTIRMNKAHFPVTVLGPGRRIGLWLQGCSIRCPGCVSRDTWDAAETSATDVDAVLAWCRALAPQAPNGITITGGEPFDQAAALTMLLDGLREWRATARLSFDILCYSGYPMRVLTRRYAYVLARLDAVAPEPYVIGQPATDPLIGSQNQRVIPLTGFGRERYGATRNEQSAKRIQLAVSDGAVWLIGIPRPGDLDEMGARCAEQGVVLKEVSWRA
jgi:anaerobic ribonucleoside-triphosphate reductase activating protein